MSVSLESLVKLAPIPGIIVRDPVSGDPALAPIQAAGIVSADGKSLEDHVASTDIHVPAATISANINTAVNTAIELLKNNGTGSDLPSEHDSLLKVSAALTDLTATLNRFLTGDADGGELVMPREGLDESVVGSAIACFSYCKSKTHQVFRYILDGNKPITKGKNMGIDC